MADESPLFYAVRDLVATKRFNDARSLLAEAAVITPEKVAAIQARFPLSDAELRKSHEESVKRHGTRSDALQRAHAKRDELRKGGREPSMKDVANALVAKKDWHASQADVLDEVFAA